DWRTRMLTLVYPKEFGGSSPLDRTISGKTSPNLRGVWRRLFVGCRPRAQRPPRSVPARDASALCRSRFSEDLSLRTRYGEELCSLPGSGGSARLPETHDIHWRPPECLANTCCTWLSNPSTYAPPPAVFPSADRPGPVRRAWSAVLRVEVSGRRALRHAARAQETTLQLGPFMCLRINCP